MRSTALRALVGGNGCSLSRACRSLASVLVGLWALRHLTDKPIEAAWLEPDERIALQARIDHERRSREAIRHYRLGEALTNPRVLGLSFVYFGLLCGLYGLVYWLPQIVKGVATEIGLDKLTGVSINALTGYLVAVPYAFATVAMIWWTRHSDTTHERVWHVVCPAVVSGLSLIGAAYLGDPVLVRLALVRAITSAWGAKVAACVFPQAGLNRPSLRSIRRLQHVPPSVPALSPGRPSQSDAGALFDSTVNNTRIAIASTRPRRGSWRRGSVRFRKKKQTRNAQPEHFRPYAPSLGEATHPRC